MTKETELPPHAFWYAHTGIFQVATEQQAILCLTLLNTCHKGFGQHP